MMRPLRIWNAFPAHAGVLLLGLAAAVGCDPYTTLKDVPVDCTVEDGYEFLTLSTYENVGDNVFWSSGDTTPGKVVGDNANGDVFVESIPDRLGGPRCGSKAAAVLRAAHNNDWGCMFGCNTFGAPRDVSATGPSGAYEGLSFWARSPGNTTKGFQIVLNDPNTAVLAGSGVTSYCKDLGGGSTGAVSACILGPDGTCMATSGSVTRPTYPDECGNGYNAIMLATDEWALYTVPFSSFQQDPKPNRVPNAALTQVGTSPGSALLTDRLLTLILRMPKEANVELWIDNLAFYRKKSM